MARKNTLEPENRYAVTVVVYVLADDPSEAEAGVSALVKEGSDGLPDVEVYDFSIEEVEPAEVV